MVLKVSSFSTLSYSFWQVTVLVNPLDPGEHNSCKLFFIINLTGFLPRRHMECVWKGISREV